MNTQGTTIDPGDFPYRDVVNVATDGKDMIFMDAEGKTIRSGPSDDAAIKQIFENVKAVGYVRFFVTVLVNDLFCIGVDNVTKGLGSLLSTVDAMKENGVDIGVVAGEFFECLLGEIDRVKKIPIHDIVESKEIH